MDSKQTRREFCGMTCRAAAVAAAGGLLSVLAGCGGGGSGSPTAPGGSAEALPVVQGSASGGTITVNVAGTALATVGALAVVRSSGTSALVARTGAATFAAFTTVCTHESNQITATSGQLFVCTVHGSRFDTNGAVAQGPASRPLRSFATQFANDVLTISV